MTVAIFAWGKIPISLEIVRTCGSENFVLNCPVCGRRAKLGRHLVSMDKRGRVQIYPALVCPNASICGWAVEVHGGVARDVDFTEIAIAV